MEQIREPIKVRNKDIPLLSSILSIMQEVRMIEERQEWQRDRMLNITQHLTGMPGGGSPKGLDEAFAALSELNFEHKQKCKQYARQLKRAQGIIGSIESETMRAFVSMKYVWDKPDTEIRKQLNMSRRGFERAKQCVEQAPSMSMVKWHEKYIIDGGENK